LELVAGRAVAEEVENAFHPGFGVAAHFGVVVEDALDQAVLARQVGGRLAAVVDWQSSGVAQAAAMPRSSSINCSQSLARAAATMREESRLISS
jgi:hypothetical protein